MSIQEKKSNKGTPYAIIKFSDQKGEFEVFLFSEILVNNRDKLKESESFLLTLQKDKNVIDTGKKRVNVKKILNLEQAIKEPYSKVTIELNQDCNMNELKEILSHEGNTSINIIIKNNNQKAHYLLQNNRKFDLKHLKALKAKDYVSKITF